MGNDEMRKNEGYCKLKDLCLDFVEYDGTFSFCFWIYLTKSTTFPTTILHQIHSDISESAPFLVINNNKRINVLPVLYLHEEAPVTCMGPWTEVPHVTVDFEFPLEKWVHVGCEVCPNYIRLHINGEIVGEKSLSSLLHKESNSSNLKEIHLANLCGDSSGVQGYVYNYEGFDTVSSIKDHHLKDPPLKLSIDESSISEVEEESDGVWGIVGGKASCRRNVSLDVVLSDAFGQPVDMENEVFASLVYADTGAPVENTTDDEAPLLSSYDGIEFSSCERPSKFLLGRASFKLRISQLSSKCDSRLFLIRFCVPKLGDYPFLQTNTRPIRCISRSRNTKLSTLVWKKSTYALERLNLSQSSAIDDVSLESMNSGHEEKTNPLMKRFRVGLDKISVSVKANPTIKQSGVECNNSHVWTANQVENGFPKSLDGRSLNFEEADVSPSESSESTGERNSPSNSMESRRYQISDMTIFKYCLAGLAERSQMLKEIAISASDKEISELAHHVSHFSGCSHHRNQILISKRLIEDGTNLWLAMSPNNHPIPWKSAVYEVEEQFMKIASCGSRSLSHQGAKMERPKVRPVEFIAAITNKKDFWKLAVRVKDKWTVVKDGKEHLELIIVDAKGNDIQLVIPTGYKAVCDKVLLENTTYTLSNFQVQKNDDAFKASDHKYKLIWTGGTNADNVNVHDIPNPSIKFKPFSEIVSGKWRADLLVHVIGIVHEMRYCQLNEGTGKKLQVNFGLKDLSDISVNCTLWEDYAAKFIKFNKDRKEGGPVIVMLNYCKIKEEGRFPLSVSNTYSFTKLSINENIPEINLFRESLPKDEQLMSSSQIQCSQSYGNTQVATEDDLLSNSQILPLSQVIQLDVISYCVTVAKIEKVNSTKNGWYYFACHKCPKIAKGDKPPYTCDDGHNTETEIVRYKLEMDVSYDMDRTVFVVWDREVTQMLGISAAQLRSNMIQVGITNRFEFPTIMDDLAEKTMVFKVKWQPRWKSCSVVCYKEGEAFTDRVRAKFPNLVEEAEPEIENLGADVMMDNTNPNPAASNEDVTISTHDLSASSEYDPDGLTQITPISGLKNAGQPMSCESLSQLTPGSFNSVAEKANARPTVEITPHKMAATDDFCNAGGHNEITPAKQTSSKRVKLIKQEKK